MTLPVIGVRRCPQCQDSPMECLGKKATPMMMAADMSLLDFYLYHCKTCHHVEWVKVEE